MCGIAGFGSYMRDFTVDGGYWHDVLVGMRESVRHRGNDDSGEYLKAHVGFAHARLSIRDLSLGAQPIVRRVGGREYTIVYNGEIYNADELKRDLQAAGCVFETTTDTEVILYAYIHYGTGFVSLLNGIFAFAIWDDARQALLLYRDRVGVKPLFYTVKNGTLVFGSEIKALFAHPEVTPEADMDSFREVFGIGPARTMENGVFRGVREIGPGCCAVFDGDGFRQTQYWDMAYRAHTDSYGETVEKVSYLVRDAVTRQMVSDVPVCSFLSGGVDSSIVTAVAAEILRQSGAVLNTFSFDFRQNDIYFRSNAFQPEQDRPYVDEMLRHYKTHHNYLVCDEAELAGLLYPAVDAKDLPGMADVDASLLYFCKLVAPHNKVVLTGECADEIFGGYPWFYRQELFMTDGFPWSRNMETRELLLKDELVRELRLGEYADARYRETIRAVPASEDECPQERRRREVAYLNIKWFMQTLLDRMDRTSMYSGLEARVPYADHRIIEYLFNVPWEMKFRNGTEKALLRDACGDLLPERVLRRKKSPYPKTYNPNYERILGEELKKVADDPNSPVMTFLDKDKVETFLRAPKEYGKPWYGQLMAGPQLMAYMLQVNYWLGKYKLV